MSAKSVESTIIKAESDEDSKPETISDTENCHNWKDHLDNPTESDDDYEADNESDNELNIDIKSLASPENRLVSATLNGPGMIQPTWKSMKQAEKGLMTDSAMEPWRNEGNKKK